MLLPELQSLAASLGISGTARMRKGELISAIQERQGGGTASTPRQRAEVAARVDAPREQVHAEIRHERSLAEPTDATGSHSSASEPVDADRRGGRASRAAGPPEPRTDRRESLGEREDSGAGRGEPLDGRGDVAGRDHPAAGRDQAGERDRAGDRDRAGERDRAVESAEEATGRGDAAGARTERADRGESAGGRGDRYERGEPVNGRNGRDRHERGVDRGSERGADRGDRTDRDRGDRDRTDRDDDDADGGRRGRRSRFRDRRRGRTERGESGGGGGGNEPQVAEDDVLVPVAGIVDVLDNYAFVRTTGFLAGSNDVYVSMAQVKRNGLRRGDAVTGAVRAPREGEQRRDKYNPLVRLDSINGMDPEEARRRPEFYKLTPLYPQERLRLETDPHILTTRVIDLVMPIGKGQRALIVSPPKAGKTMVLQALANAITRNNPECHLMVVLVDERPEEVTDMQRSVKGEVIASTFDRPPQDHTTVSELAIERAKRLVELGHDVVVLLDSITRLGRAYNLAAPASGRILSGGIDSTALYPPKRFLGAARNIENGGSLTILATALVETGSMMDTVIFEEFKGTGNAELKLDRKIADKRIFPAIDIDPSGTRKEEILLAPDELVIVHKLRKVLHSLDSQAALDLLLDKLKQTRTNIEFLMQIAKTTPGD